MFHLSQRLLPKIAPVILGGFFLAVTTLAEISDASSSPEATNVTPPALNEAPNTHQRWNRVPEPFDLNAHYTEEFYVSPRGQDVEGHGSRSRPFRTIRRALQVAEPGTRISILAGVYPGIGTIQGLAGTLKLPIAIVGKGEVVIDGGAESVGLHLSGPHHVIIEGLTFRNTWPHGVNIDDGGTYESPAHHLILRDLRFKNIGDGGNNDCLKLSGIDNFWVLASEFEQCNQGEAIDMVGCHDGVVSRNTFHDIPRNAVQTKGGSRDILIHANRFTDIAQRAINAGGHTGRTYFRPLSSQYEAAHIHMVANVFERIGDTPIAFVGCYECVFANNTVVHPMKFVARILEENRERGPGENGLFINNILVLRKDYLSRGSLIDIGDNALPESLKVNTNLWVSPKLAKLGYKPLIAIRLGGGTNVTVAQDAGFRDLARDDYRLTAVSPGIGRGRPVPGGLPGDFLGRPYSHPPSIGAHRSP